MSYLPTTGNTAAGNAAVCELWDSIPEASIHWVDTDEFTQAYIECALWSSLDKENPLDERYNPDDIDHTALGRMIRDCQRFQGHARQMGIYWPTDRIRAINPNEGSHDSYAGHDFWLTRNGHGAGFWDGDWEHGDELTVLAQSFGECDLYPGDDGRLYL